MKVRCGNCRYTFEQWVTINLPKPTDPKREVQEDIINASCPSCEHQFDLVIKGYTLIQNEKGEWVYGS